MEQGLKTVVGLAHLKNAQVQDSISHMREEIEEKVAREIAGAKEEILAAIRPPAGRGGELFSLLQN